MNKDSGYSQKLAEELRASVDAILASWLKRIRSEIPGAVGQSDVFLIDHMPKFLTSVADALRTPENHRAYVSCFDNAKAHGRQRALSNYYTSASVVAEYSILREETFSKLTDGFALTAIDIAIIVKLFEAAIGAAVEEFTRHFHPAANFNASETRLRAIFAHTSVGFAISEISGRFVDVNPSFCEITGYAAEELVQMEAKDLIHADDRQRDGEMLTALLNRETSNFIIEKRFIKKDGSIAWVKNSVSLVPSDSGDELVIRVAEDITDVKALANELETAHRALEVEQQKFKTIFAHSATSMAVLQGPEFVYEIANPSYLKLFNDRDIVGKPFIVALPELVGQQFPAQAKKVFESGEPYIEMEARAFLSRTAEAPVEERFFDQSYTRMMNENGEPYGVFIHAIEVTDRIRARQEFEETAARFKIAVEAADMGTWDLDPVNNTIEWSDKTRELFGAAKSEKTELQTAVARIHPDDRERVSAAISAAIDPNGTGDYRIDYRVLNTNNEIRWISLLGRAFFKNTPTGRETTRLSGTALDITDRMLAEVSLRDAKERAELANAAKSSFLANMSHEIRTPLGAIMGFVSLIKDESLNPQTLHQYVSVIERNSVQLMRIIDDILDLSKVEAGMMLIEHINFSLIELLSDFASLMGFRAREKGVLFELKAKTELPSVINSDPTRIRQILTNIVGNAIKFTDQGSVVLNVSFVKDSLEFDVIDTGRGITAEQSELLFQPFSQGDASTTRKYGGTGLGLVLTRRLSEAMGGVFELISSQPGIGSRFISRIHVELGEGAQFVRALGFASEVIRNAGVFGELKDMRILLVEDSPDNQALFSIYLSRAGAKIDIASDGLTGLEMAQSGNYDVVLMDVQMPVMDGITAVKRLRAAQYTGPVLALTAHAMKEEKIRCLEAGYTGFLSKPIQRGELVEALKAYVLTK